MSRDKHENAGKWRQLFATLVANLSSLAYGVIIGWASPTIPLLQSEKPPVGDRPLTEDEIAWLNGILCLAALVFLPFCSKLAEHFGRKVAICLMSVPFIVCWLLTAFACNYTWLFIARLLAGIGSAMCLFLLPIYVCEISCDSLRGIFGSVLMISSNIGTVVGFILGDILSYRDFALVSIIFCVISFVGFLFMPETPIYLIRKSRMDDATRSLMWLKNNDEVAVNYELVKLQKMAALTSQANKSIGVKDLFRDRGTIRGFIIGLGLLCGQMISGITIVLTYTATIFQLAGSTMTPNASAIVVGIIQVIGSCVSTVVIERAGRRPLMFVSCLGMAGSLCVLAGFFMAQTHGKDLTPLAWIPVTALSVCTVAYCLGMGPVPFIVSAEVFHADILSFANSICMGASWFAMFVVMKFFPLVTSVIGNHGCFFLFAALCTSTFFFTYFFVPETKGRPIESILNELSGCSRVFGRKVYSQPDFGLLEQKSVARA